MSVALALPFLLLSGLLLAPAAATATSDADPVAFVDGVPLTRGEYKDFLFQEYGVGALDVFINEKILAALAKRDGVTVTDKDAADWIEARVKEASGMPELQELDPVELRKQYAPVAKTACLVERLIKKRRLGEEGLKREYELRYGEKRRARHILVRASEAKQKDTDRAADEAAKKKIDALYEKIEKGADFAQLAKTESQDPGSAEHGGELPEFNRFELVPAFSEVAFKLKEGEVSKPVRSDYGYHIIQVTKIIPPAKPLEPKLLEEIKAEAEKRPVDREEHQRFLKEIRKGVKIEKKLE